MSTQQLRNLVIDKISGIEDEEILKALNLILDTGKQSKRPYKTTAQEKERIKAGLKLLKKGKIISNEELEKSEDEWLKK